MVFDCVFPLHWESTALRHTAHVCCACQPCGRRQWVCLPCARAALLSTHNRHKSKDWQREQSPQSCSVISVNGGPLSEWNRSYITHSENRQGLRLPQVLFCVNGEKGLRERDACCSMGWEGGEIPVVSTEKEKHRASAPTHALHSTADFLKLNYMQDICQCMILHSFDNSA